MQSDRSIQDILETLALSDDESQLSFSAKEMRTALNLYMSYKRQAEEWKDMHREALGEPPKEVKYPEPKDTRQCRYDVQRAAVQGWNECLQEMKELNA